VWMVTPYLHGLHCTDEKSVVKLYNSPTRVSVYHK
jgi:hypothetical protein